MNKRAQELPVQVIVMMMLGLVLFGIGMALFFQISGSSEATIDELNAKIKSDISSLECSGDQWICSPSYKLGNGDVQTFEVFVANKADTNVRYSVDFSSGLTQVDTAKYGIENDCGAVLVSYPNQEVNILSGHSASFPFVVRASRVRDTPCSFVSTVILNNEFGEEVGKTPIIVRVE